jgi:VWFA-related protein
LTIAAGVDLVVFNVTVSDEQGRYVFGLQPGDFLVREEGQPQEIRLFNAEDTPASVGIILDNSGSMLDKRREVARAAIAFADAAGPGDELFVVNFNENVYFGLPLPILFTNDVRQLRAALLTAPPGLTALYDGVAAGLAHLESAARARQALVVLSDGGDNASQRSLEDLLQIVHGSSATIFTIGLYDETNRDRNPGVLRRLSRESGGRAYFPDSLDDLEDVWIDIAGGIRSQYTIGYHSTNRSRDGAFRRVTIAAIRSGKPGLRVTTRDGYVAPDDGTRCELSPRDHQ